MRPDPVALRRALIRAVGFCQVSSGLPALVEDLGCVQLDPIDRFGTSPELVAWARETPGAGARRGGLFSGADGAFFEHFYKERCLIHPRMFPAYRALLAEGSPTLTAWWGPRGPKERQQRARRLDAGLIGEVLAEVAERGPVAAEEMDDRGRVEPLDWGGWSGTASRTKMALEVLWARCEVVIATRDGRGRKLYAAPARALPAWADRAPGGDLAEALLLERARSAGLLPERSGPWWGVIQGHRADGTADRLVDQGRLARIAVGTRRYLALPEALAADDPISTGPLRVIAPLDPLLWDRELVRALWGFDYTWDIYKPAAQRQFGYYVCPVLDGEALAGRIECVREAGELRLIGAWEERPGALAPDRLRACLEELAWRNGCGLADALPPIQARPIKA